MAIRCLIIDDNHAFLVAARVLLEREGLTVAGVASTGDDALRQTKALRPDVVLVDISLGAESGIDLAQRLIQDRANDAVVVLISTRAEDEVADLIAERPPIVFLPKSELSAATIRRIVEANASGTRGK
jgi:DNA-binding NarL/FixJ family response regulator